MSDQPTEWDVTRGLLETAKLSTRAIIGLTDLVADLRDRVKELEDAADERP